MDIKWQAQNHKCCLWVMIFWNTCNGKFFGKQRKGGKAGTEEKRERKRPQISLCRIQWYFPRSSLLKPVSIRRQNRNWLQLKVYCHCQKNHKARLGKKVKILIAWNESMHPWHAEQTMDAYIPLERKQTPRWFFFLMTTRLWQFRQWRNGDWIRRHNDIRRIWCCFTEQYYKENN